MPLMIVLCSTAVFEANSMLFFVVVVDRFKRSHLIHLTSKDMYLKPPVNVI